MQLPWSTKNWEHPAPTGNVALIRQGAQLKLNVDTNSRFDSRLDAKVQLSPLTEMIAEAILCKASIGVSVSYSGSNHFIV